MQAVVKAYILFQKWMDLMNTHVDKRIAEMKARGDDPTIQMKLKAQLEHLETTMMLCWVKTITDHLMPQCQIDKEEAAGGRGAKKRRRDPVDEDPVKWFGNRFKGLRCVSIEPKRFTFAIGRLVECAAARGVEKVTREVFHERGFAVRVARLPWPTKGHRFLLKPRERGGNTCLGPLPFRCKFWLCIR